MSSALSKDLHRHDRVPADGDPLPGRSGPVVVLDGISKSYGPTRVNENIHLSISPGEILGLVGANGAGKSTLMRILCGVTQPDSGTLAIAGTKVEFASHSPREARARGIRIVHQELSLCTNLTVAENFFLESPDHGGRAPLWRPRYRALARQGIEAVFPNSGIAPDAVVGGLTLGQRQMVEIARAAGDPALRLLILDEPTSSLDSERGAQLHAFIRRRARDGVSFIFISHKLREVLDVVGSVVVMRNGRVVRAGPAAGFTIHALVELMGGDGERRGRRTGSTPDANAGHEPAPLLRIGGRVTAPLGRPIDVAAGTVLGLAGLEGAGQKELLHRIRACAAGGRDADLACTAKAGFVSGDRQREGVFALWDVLRNMTIADVARRSFTALLSPGAEREAAEQWAGRLRLAPERLPSRLLDLSGGNQQKALVARALLPGFDIVLLDDPMRGVDIGAKHDFYRVIREAADAGRLVVWLSTEDVELLECDRVLVFQNGAVVRDLEGEDISEDGIVGGAFQGEASARSATAPAAAAAPTAAGPGTPNWTAGLVSAMPLASLALVAGALGWLNPSAASLFGVDLLLSSAVPLVLIALAQMIVVGGSQVDLGIGAYAGLVNVVSATLLVEQPALGAAMLAAVLAGYSLLGAVIERRRIPAIVVTLGASFIWLGCGFTLQAAPGGSSPDWLAAAFGWQIPGLPTAAVMVVLAGLCGLLVDRSRLGVVLRAFGNNGHALVQAGWSPLRHSVLRYLVAGLFATAAGLSMTAITTASDINAGSGFTLLSIAAVVIGGCRLVGGVTAPAGVVAGAVTLSLIGSLLSFLDISTDYNAAVQGLLLIGILALRTLIDRKETEA
ncbi:ATP-binding cassette domain-containing protein [Azospirillum endophyticum]